VADGSLAARARALLVHLAFSARVALEAVSHNTLRAALTSLGILFGVASVIAMLAIGKGAEQEILEQMRLLGSNNVIVTPLIEQKEEQVRQEEGKKEPKRYTPGLTVRDAQGLQAIVPEVEATSGEVVLQTLITREGRRRSGKVVGVDTTYFRLVNLALARETPFSPLQVARGAPVVIIGHGVRARFFTTQDPIGRQLKVGDNWLTVIGVLEDRKLSDATAQKLGIRDANMDVYVPLSTMLLRYRNRAEVTTRDVERASSENDNDNQNANVDPAVQAERRNYHQLDRVIVRVAEARCVPGVAEVMQRFLKRRHNQVVDFEITVPEALLRQERRTRTIFNVVLGAIASISLLVGGIGIMNIMLASVLERIKEIGVRRAVGASQRDILAQFLSEAVMISLSGGIAGVLAGGALSLGIAHFAGIRTIVSPFSVALAVGVSLTVGLVFGIVPAWRAAQQDPVVCLRYE
jgi:putative ABC transport system permease protein